jgi:hypothetical protein
MFVVHLPVSSYGHPMSEEWQLRCSACGKRFRSLSECFLCYEVPSPGARSQATCCHKRCAGATTRLQRADYAFKSLLQALLQPTVPLAKDLPRRIGRPWGDP